MLSRLHSFRPMQWLLAVLVAVILIMMCSCATTAKLNTDPVAQAAVAAVVDVAVGEAVQQGVQPAAMVQIAAQLQAFDTGQATTVPALAAEIQTLVAKANLNPAQVAAVTILEATLNAVISQQLQAASSAPGGALNADTITTINIVLQDIVTAAQLYSGQPAQPPTTSLAPSTPIDIPPQNRHFVLSSVESPQVVGASASLVLIACLQAFAHVDVNAPVGAAITVLFTVGAAAIDNLIN